MPKGGLTGSRIRERRISMGLRQVALARSVGISAAYLNLIEHNRRRIGGKLLLEISRVLEVDATQLTEGAEVALLAALGQAATAQAGLDAETDRAEELAGRFPGWAALIASQQRRIEALEQTVSALTDRLTHDPQLAASMHEVISVVTAIRSTSAILADGGEIDPEWQNRFHRNMYEDSQRLAESAQALVQYLDAAGEGETDAGLILPQEELENWLAGQDYFIAGLEGADSAAIDAVLNAQPDISRAATTAALARRYLERYRRDAEIMPLDAVIAAVEQVGIAPARIARRFNCDLATALRRLACVPAQQGQNVGLVICDSSGTLTFRKPLDGFPLPRFGAACPLWPLFQTLSRPLAPMRVLLEQSGHIAKRFLCFAIAQPATVVDFDTPPVFEATMLIVPQDTIETAGEMSREISGEIIGNSLVTQVGSSCRICPRRACGARREPSIMTDGF